MGFVLYVPFPASTHLGLLFHSTPVNLSAGDAPGTMPLAGNDVHQRGKEYLTHGKNDSFGHPAGYRGYLRARLYLTYL